MATSVSPSPGGNPVPTTFAVSGRWAKFTMKTLVMALLGDGGEVYMPLAETFCATRFSQLRDRFGVSWPIIHERPRP